MLSLRTLKNAIRERSDQMSLQDKKTLQNVFNQFAQEGHATIKTEKFWKQLIRQSEHKHNPMLLAAGAAAEGQLSQHEINTYQNEFGDNSPERQLLNAYLSLSKKNLSNAIYGAVKKLSKSRVQKNDVLNSLASGLRSSNKLKNKINNQKIEIDERKEVLLRLNKKINDLTAKAQNLETNNNELKMKNEEAQKKVKKLLDKISNQEIEINKQDQSLNKLRKEITDLTAQEESLKTNVTDLEKQKESLIYGIQQLDDNENPERCTELEKKYTQIREKYHLLKEEFEIIKNQNETLTKQVKKLQNNKENPNKNFVPMEKNKSFDPHEKTLLTTFIKQVFKDDIDPKKLNKQYVINELEKQKNLLDQAQTIVDENLKEPNRLNENETLLKDEIIKLKNENEKLQQKNLEFTNQNLLKEKKIENLEIENEKLEEDLALEKEYIESVIKICEEIFKNKYSEIDFKNILTNHYYSNLRKEND